jgi:multisubunit Na+/H+ antiporter MnhF subunit
VSPFLVTALVMLVALIPCGVVVIRGSTMEAVIAYEAIASVIVLVLLLIAAGLRRSGEFELAEVSAVLVYGGGLLFVRFMERGLR